MHIGVGKKVADIYREGMKARRQIIVMRAKAVSKLKLMNKSCSPNGDNHQQEMSVQINQEKTFCSSQVSALLT